MKEGGICCCLRPSVWAKTIALSQFVIFSSGFYKSSFLFWVMWTAEGSSNGRVRPYTLGQVLLFLFTIFGLAASSLLLYGSYYKNHKHLQIWVMYTMFSSIGLFGFVILVGIIDWNDWTMTSGISIRGLFLVLWGSFLCVCVWIVNTYKQEIEASLSPVYLCQCQMTEEP